MRATMVLGPWGDVPKWFPLAAGLLLISFPTGNPRGWVTADSRSTTHESKYRNCYIRFFFLLCVVGEVVFFHVRFYVNFYTSGIRVCVYILMVVYLVAKFDRLRHEANYIRDVLAPSLVVTVLRGRAMVDTCLNIPALSSQIRICSIYCSLCVLGQVAFLRDQFSRNLHTSCFLLGFFTVVIVHLMATSFSLNHRTKYIRNVLTVSPVPSVPLSCGIAGRCSKMYTSKYQIRIMSIYCFLCISGQFIVFRNEFCIHLYTSCFLLGFFTTIIVHLILESSKIDRKNKICDAVVPLSPGHRIFDCIRCNANTAATGCQKCFGFCHCLFNQFCPLYSNMLYFFAQAFFLKELSVFKATGWSAYVVCSFSIEMVFKASYITACIAMRLSLLLAHDIYTALKRCYRTLLAKRAGPSRFNCKDYRRSFFGRILIVCALSLVLLHFCIAVVPCLLTSSSTYAVVVSYRSGKYMSSNTTALISKHILLTKHPKIWIRDCGSTVGQHQRCCLQKAIAECLPGEVRSIWLTGILSIWDNSEPTGTQSPAGRTNLHRTDAFLQALHYHVKILCRGPTTKHDLHKYWCVCGSLKDPCAGHLLCDMRQEHVYVLRGKNVTKIFQITYGFQTFQSSND